MNLDCNGFCSHKIRISLGSRLALEVLDKIYAYTSLMYGNAMLKNYYPSHADIIIALDIRLQSMLSTLFSHYYLIRHDVNKEKKCMAC